MESTILYDPKSTSHGTDWSQNELGNEYDDDGIVGVLLEAWELILGSHAIHHDLCVVSWEDNDTVYVLSISERTATKNDIVCAEWYCVLSWLQELTFKFIDRVVWYLTFNGSIHIVQHPYVLSIFFVDVFMYVFILQVSLTVQVLCLNI